MKPSCLFAAVALAAFASPAATASSTAVAAPAEPGSQFARCAVQHYEGAELLATQPGSAEEAEVLAEYARRSCAAPSADAQLLRGAVAEQLFKSDFGSIGARPQRDYIEVFTVDVEAFDELDAASRRRLDMLAFGTCVAAASPAKAVVLLQSSAGSAEEARTVAELQPSFSPCLDEGAQLNLGKAELRGVLAEGAYRLALAHSLDQEIVVTGTRDSSRSVVCKMQSGVGSLMRRQLCLTEAQWTRWEQDTKYAAQELRRQAEVYQELRTLCLMQSMGGEGSQACLMD